MSRLVVVLLAIFVCAARALSTTQQTLSFSVYVGDKDKGEGVKVVTGTLDSANANAYGTYHFNSSANGWNYLDVHAKANPSSSEEHMTNIFALGFAEGYASCNEIRTFWPNFYTDLFRDLNTPPGANTLKFIQDQWTWFGMMIDKYASTDQYWFAQGQTRRQLEGLFAGFKQGCPSAPHLTTGSGPRPNEFWSTLNQPTMEHFLLINAWGDLYQITVKMKEPGQFSRLHGKDRSMLVERCSAFVKLLPGNSDVYFGHNTWDAFDSLGPRILKKMHFPLWQTNAAASAAPLVQYTTLFSSSPAVLSSIDDFFVVRGLGHMGVQETTNSLYNLKVLNTIIPQTALSWQRATAANQLSATGTLWAQNFAKYSSGTYTNQWMVVDFQLFSAGNAPSAGFFTVYEEVPGLTHWEDMTPTLVSTSFWASYNNPFFADIRQASGYAALCNLGDVANCYDGAPRYFVFQEQQSSVTDLASMQHIMRYNAWQTDPASDNNSCHSIACRGDLEVDANSIGAFGALDAKISSVNMNVNTATGALVGDGCNAYAVLGPTQQNQPVFCWSTYAGSDTATYSHAGQPDCFDFDWIYLPPK